MRTILLLILFSAAILHADVIIEPRNKDRAEKYINFINVHEFPGKICLVYKTERDDDIRYDQLTNLKGNPYFSFNPDESSPVVIITDSTEESMALSLTGTPAAELIEYLEKNHISYLKSPLPIPRNYQRYKGSSKAVFDITISVHSSDSLEAKVKAIHYYNGDGYLGSDKFGSLNIDSPDEMKVLCADVAPDPTGLFGNEFLFFILPAAGIIIFLIIRRKRKQHDEN